MLRIDKQYTPDELRIEYATKARTMFDEHQKWRGRCAFWNLFLLFSVVVLGTLAIKFEVCRIALIAVSLALLLSRLSQKALDHALAAMTCLRHAQTFERMVDFDKLQSAIEAFEVDTLHG